MCAERIQRLIMAFMISFTLVLFINNLFTLAIILQLFIVSLIVVWALFDFCPSLWILQRTLGSCHSKG